MKRTIYNEEKAKMNPQFNKNVVKMEIFHKDFNLDKKDNLDEIPDQPAVFGIFGIIHETPIHPRTVGATPNLRQRIREIFEKPESEGLKNFMQSPWIQMLCFEPLPGASQKKLTEAERKWVKRYNPQVTDEGEYPEYKYVWPYDEIDD